MAAPGVWNDLTILRISATGAFLDGGPDGQILLPSPEVPAGCAPGETLRVFLFFDAKDRLAATQRTPGALRGEVANLKIAAVNKSGAFLAWGLPKDLLLPWAEVKKDLKPRIAEGEDILVILFKDDHGRIAASTRLEEFLSDEAEGLQEGDEVALVIGERTDLGLKVVVNHRFWGMVHNSELFRAPTRGEKRVGYVKALRADHKLNISLNAPGYAKVGTIAQDILAILQRHGGYLAVTDRSQPEEIYALFGVSKKAFKQAVGTLYKSRQIVIEEGGIRVRETV